MCAFKQTIVILPALKNVLFYNYLAYETRCTAVSLDWSLKFITVFKNLIIASQKNTVTSKKDQFVAEGLSHFVVGCCVMGCVVSSWHLEGA
jgi:hypothetical protein